MLRRNVEANGLTERVTVFDEAVGRGSGELRLWTNVNSLTSTGYGETPPAPEAVVTHVPLIDLDEVVRRAGGGPVALLKMDTEGAEVDTLEGASPTTLRAIKQVILEYHLRASPDAQSRCLKVLEQAGFHCRVQPLHVYHGLIYAWRTDL
jgi:FkbM family methyltransferase